MVPILIVAHAPLASALRSVAEHVYLDRCRMVGVVDVPAGASPEEVEAQILATWRQLGGEPALIMVDAFGATPCQAARGVAEAMQARVVTGVNVPMLWRTLCYSGVALDELVSRAAAGATQGVMHVTPSRRQNQPVPPTNHDQEDHQHQQ